MFKNDTAIYRDVRSGTNILDQQQFQETIMAISDVATEMVIKTLGPGGAATVIDDGVNVYATKDGLHSLENLSFNDPVYNTIYRLLRSSSFHSAHIVGDGTTTAMVISNAFMHFLQEELKTETWKDVPQQTILNAIKSVAVDIKEAILNSDDIFQINRAPDASYDDIYNVAYVSSNGNEKLATMIRDIYRETGSPHIHISSSPNTDLTYEIISGYRFNCRCLDLDKFANTTDGCFAEVDGTIKIFMFDHTVSFVEHRYIISTIINVMSKSSYYVMIFAPHFDDIIVSLVNTANNNRKQQGRNPIFMLVQIPIGTELDRANIEDLSILMNCEVFNYPRASIFRSMIAAKLNHEENKKLEDDMIDATEYNYGDEMDIISACCGTITTITLKKDSAIIQGYDKVADMDVLHNHMLAVEKKYAEASERAKLANSTASPDFMNSQNRYIRLRGSVGVIAVGGKTSLEREFVNDAVEDAVFACRSAYENGIIRGLNLTTLSEIYKLSQHIAYNADERKNKILEIFRNAFFVASEAVFNNMGIDKEHPAIFSVVDERLYYDEKELTPAQAIMYCLDSRRTIDLRSRTISMERIVINPVTTDTEIIDSVVSIIGTLMTSTQLLTRNRQFDRGMTRAIATENELEMIRMTKEAEAQGYLKGLANSSTVSINLDVLKKDKTPIE